MFSFLHVFPHLASTSQLQEVSLKTCLSPLPCLHFYWHSEPLHRTWSQALKYSTRNIVLCLWYRQNLYDFLSYQNSLDKLLGGGKRPAGHFEGSTYVR